MYLSYEEFASITLAKTEGEDPDISENEYVRLAPMADAIIDDWTLERVGKAVEKDEELPDVVKGLYAAIVENLPALIESGKLSTGGLVSTFSNGTDSYSFDNSKAIQDQLYQSLGWMLNMLPVEWCSECVYFEGGNKNAG